MGSGPISGLQGGIVQYIVYFSLWTICFLWPYFPINTTQLFYVGGIVKEAEGNKGVYRPAYVVLIDERP